jgi:hypothetical protein
LEELNDISRGFALLETPRNKFYFKLIVLDGIVRSTHWHEKLKFVLWMGLAYKLIKFTKF